MIKTEFDSRIWKRKQRLYIVAGFQSGTTELWQTMPFSHVFDALGTPLWRKFPRLVHQRISADQSRLVQRAQKTAVPCSTRRSYCTVLLSFHGVWLCGVDVWRQQIGSGNGRQQCVDNSRVMENHGRLSKVGHLCPRFRQITSYWFKTLIRWYVYLPRDINAFSPLSTSFNSPFKPV